MSMLLLLMPEDPAQGLRCLLVGADGSVTRALDVPAGQAIPPEFSSDLERTVLVVPGSDVGNWTTDLPARDPTQARAAARLLLADRAAEPVEGLHIALGPLQPRQPRQLCWVKAGLLGRWLERVASLQVQVDAALPDYLALPDPRESVAVAQYQGRWLVRGPGLAFSAEPELARQVLGDRRFQWIDEDEVEASLARGVLDSQANLLQYEFAPRRGIDPRRPSRRRLLVLASLVLASPLVLLLAEAGRYKLAARSLYSQIDAIAAPYVAAGASGDAAALLGAALAQREAPARAARLRQLLFEAIAGVPGTRIDAIESGADAGLQATVAHATPLQLQQLQDALAARGARTTPTPLQANTDGLRTRLLLEPLP